MSDEPLTITRKPANSGNLSYAAPVELHLNSRTKVELVPFYIHRTNGDQLTIKIITYAKGEPPYEWVENEVKSISLNGDSTRKLYGALKDLLAAEEVEDGSYLFIRVEDGIAKLNQHNPAQVAKALTTALSQDEIIEHLQTTELSEKLVVGLKTVIKLHEMRAAVEKLRSMLTDGVYEESEYQSWCEQHTWAFGNAYVVRDDWHNITISDRLDLILPNVIGGYRDIVELKRPDMSVLLYDNGHKSFYFSSDVSKTIGQCHRYLDVFQQAASQGLIDHPEIVAYHPRSIIVIGRSHDWETEKLKALRGLNSRLSCISVMTYDQLLAQGERLIEMLEPSPPTNVDEELDDAIPF